MMFSFASAIFPNEMLFSLVALKLLPEYGRNTVPEEDLIDQSLRSHKAFFSEKVI